ncbi:interaptin-like isoform X2 [Dendronephthya gigantea]|uniref:interaptin-like isoform X2 n=1 Tax=Dendronephthya gigantea TaxID=151771 RepID=UPI00106917F8|nr:interaptin-like isoform X2 [Dendronephthya gigantea]
MSEQYLDTLTANDLKQIIANQQNEINTKDEILKRIEDLFRRVFNELNKLRSRPMTNERLKEAGENIAALINEFVLGIGPQTALNIDSVNSGVSRNASDAVTEENTEEGSELTHPNIGITIRKLCEMVIKLFEQIVQSGHHVNEVKETSASRENELVSKLKKCEADLKSENEEKEKIQKQLSESNQEECERLRRENQSHMDEIHRLESEKKDLARVIHNLLMEKKENNIFCKKLLNSLQKLFRALETHQPGNPLPELDQGDTIQELELDNSNFQAQQVAEKDAMIAMFIDTLKAYVDDFKNEYKEKEKIQKQLNESNQESERLRLENQSHMATKRNLENEVERMNKLLNEKNKSNPNIGFPFGQLLGSSVPQSFFRDRNPSPETLMIECPYCSRSYPYHLFEGHVQDCTENSLYMDD